MNIKSYVFDKRKRNATMFGFNFGISLNEWVNYNNYYAECQKHLGDAAPAKYLQRFGLPFEFLVGYGVGYDPERELIIVPHSQAFFTSVYIGDPNKPCPTFQFKGKYEFFNYQALDCTGQEKL